MFLFVSSTDRFNQRCVLLFFYHSEMIIKDNLLEFIFFPENELIFSTLRIIKLFFSPNLSFLFSFIKVSLLIKVRSDVI